MSDKVRRQRAQPLNRYPVGAFRIESGSLSDERFFVWEIDLSKDDLGPRALPAWVSETQARSRLAELGLTPREIDDRIAAARQWMQTRVLPAGEDPTKWHPPSRRAQTVDEVFLTFKPGIKRNRSEEES